MENKEKPELTLSLKEAILLKKQLGESITYSELNSKEITELEKIDNTEWRNIRKEHIDWLESNSIVKMNVYNILFAICIIVSTLAYFKHIPEQHYKVVLIVSLIIGIYCLNKNSSRMGEIEGYFDGYRGGLQEGIRRTLNISKEKHIEIHKMATEMELDDMMARNINNKD